MRDRLLNLYEDSPKLPRSAQKGSYLSRASAYKRWKWWKSLSRTMTCLIPSRCLRGSNSLDELQMEQAWREKAALCMLIVIFCLALGFVTFGLSIFVCQAPGCIYKHADVMKNKENRWYLVHGLIYHIPDHFTEYHETGGTSDSDPFRELSGRDITVYFPYNPTCKRLGYTHEFECELAKSGHNQCYSVKILSKLHQLGQARWEWSEIDNNPQTLTYNGIVLDIGYYLDQIPENAVEFPFGKEVDRILRKSVGGDATKAFTQLDSKMIRCLIESFGAGTLDAKSVGCILTDIVLYVSLVTILAVIFIKFILSALFICVFSKRQHQEQISNVCPDQEQPVIAALVDPELATLEKRPRFGSRYAMALKQPVTGPRPNFPRLSNHDMFGVDNPESDQMYTIMLITCYSEDRHGLSGTIESLVETDYPDDHKLLFIVSDGLVLGSRNDKTTPELLVEMMEVDKTSGTIQGQVWSSLASIQLDGDHETGENIDIVNKKHMSTVYGETPPSIQDKDWLPMAYSYVAIADGTKRHNMARVFAGHYNSKGHRVPALVVVKCGTPEEAVTPKPGNRGKRDSQIILMSFLSKVLFNDRMTPLEYDMYIKIKHLMGISADKFETVLCVDADTRVRSDSLRYMINAMKNDPLVMGMCGETQIANKADNWVTAIQVFEYFISHYLNKAFESVFGGVTCLPGCFCMYRIKARKGPPGCWVPVLGSPDIVDSYSENVTDTLHKKNLLLLGEDRYLTTLMLKTFPKRKLIFVPAAKCKTVVPDKFGVLLSQRRRWINSTVHNLFELVLVPDLCGTFCFSMQFVIFMELAGTLVLPAAICFTGVLIVSSFLRDVEYIPLFLLLAILGLPALLIFFAVRSFKYFLYMICYLASLPVWNFVFPVYAFWNFDDFTWGRTQIVEDELKELHGSKKGEFDSSKIFMRRWSEYELDISTRLESNQ